MPVCIHSSLKPHLVQARHVGKEARCKRYPRGVEERALQRACHLSACRIEHDRALGVYRVMGPCLDDARHRGASLEHARHVGGGRGYLECPKVYRCKSLTPVEHGLEGGPRTHARAHDGPLEGAVVLRARHPRPGSEGTGDERAHLPPTGIPRLCGEDVEGAHDIALTCGRVMDRPGDRPSGGVRRHFRPIRAQMRCLLTDQPPVHKRPLARIDRRAVDRDVEVAPLEPDAAAGHVGGIDRYGSVIVGARVIGPEHQVCRRGRTCERHIP